jgi:hypothetical protein
MSSKRGGKPRAKGARDLSISVNNPFLGKAKLDYKPSRSVTAPLTRSSTGRVASPRVVTTAHSERVSGTNSFFSVQNLSSDTTDSGFSFSLNPGLTSQFPWLSQQAALFSKYRFHKLCFRYTPFVPATAKGNIVLFGDSNVQNELPTSFATALSYERAVFGPIWHEISFPCPDVTVTRYVRTGQLTANEDSKTYDVFKFGFLTSSIGDDVQGLVGTIFVDYDIEFLDRRLPPPAGCELFKSVYQAAGSTNGPTDFFTGPTLNPIIQHYADESGVQFLGFPMGYWLISFQTSSQDMIAGAWNEKIGWSLTAVSSNDQAVLQESSGSDVVDDQFFNPLVPGTGGYGMLGVASADSPGSCIAYWAVYSSIDAVPVVEGQLGPGQGWIQLAWTDFLPAATLAQTTTMVCRLPAQYAANFGLGTGLPVLTPRSSASLAVQPLTSRHRPTRGGFLPPGSSVPLLKPVRASLAAPTVLGCPRVDQVDRDACAAAMTAAVALQQSRMDFFAALDAYACARPEYASNIQDLRRHFELRPSDLDAKLRILKPGANPQVLVGLMLYACQARAGEPPPPIALSS